MLCFFMTINTVIFYMVTHQHHFYFMRTPQNAQFWHDACYILKHKATHGSEAHINTENNATRHLVKRSKTMTTIQRTLSILAMAAFVGLACNATDAEARGNNNHNNSKQVVQVEKTTVHKVVTTAPVQNHKAQHKAPVQHHAPQKVTHVVHHAAPSPFGISISNGHVSVSLPGIHIR